MALSAEIVNFVGLNCLHDAHKIGRISEIAVMKNEVTVFLVRVCIEVINPIGVDQRSPTLDAVNFVTLFEKKFREIRAILAGDTCDKGFLQSVVLLECLICKSRL